METLYVGKDSLEAAKKFEQRFSSLPSEAGILFASVSAVPAVSGLSRNFRICLGISRFVDEPLGVSLVKEVLRKEIESGIGVEISIYRGVAGTANDKDFARSDTAPK
jgi:hypothetical protein